MDAVWGLMQGWLISGSERLHRGRSSQWRFVCMYLHSCQRAGAKFDLNLSSTTKLLIGQVINCRGLWSDHDSISGDWTIAFWIRPTGKEALIEELGHFYPHVQFLSKTSPPQHNLVCHRFLWYKRVSTVTESLMGFAGYRALGKSVWRNKGVLFV